MLTYYPKDLLKKTPKKTIKDLLTKRLTLNRVVLARLAATGIVSERTLAGVALNVINEYRNRVAYEIDEGLTRDEAVDEAIGDKAALVNRVENAIVYQVSQEIKEKYEGERYQWLPSDAETPDPEHQLNYGKIFIVGDGEMPGERWGCRCGMRILTDDEELEL